MWVTTIALWACSHVGVACGPVQQTPTMANIQAAYSREAAAGSKLHDPGLRLIEAQCDGKPSKGRYLCQVTFLSKSDPTQRLYYDIVAVAPITDGWELKSGLCKQ
jgi:hypothetical protein